MNYKLLLYLSIRYIKAHKTLFLPFIIIIFLSTFLISTAFIIKDSYDDYALRLAQKQNGAWDVSYAYQGINYLNDYDKQLINEQLTPIMYEEYLPYYKNTREESFRAVTNFDVLPITLIEGTYPTNTDELLIEQSFSNSTNYTIGNKITVYDDGTKHTYTITGTIREVLDLPITRFYTYLDDTTQAFTVYANIKDGYVQNFYSESQTFILNEEVVNVKYHLNKSFEVTYPIFISFLCLCAFIFIYNATSLYLHKKQTYLTQLHMLGATKKQVIVCIFFEFFLLCGTLFCISLCSSLLLWYLVFYIFGNLLTQHLKLSIPFQYVLENEHLVLLCSIILVIFILSFLLTIKKTHKPKRLKLHFRNVKFHRLPLQLRIALLDTIRTGYSRYIILTLTICSTLFLTTQYIVKNWLKEQKTLVANAYDVTASFNLFSHNANQVNETLHQMQQTCTTYQASECFIQYSIQHEIYIGDMTVTGYTLDATTYQNLLKKHNLSNQDIILVHQNASNQLHDEMHIHILDSGRSQIEISSVPYTQIYDETLPISTLDDMIALIPPSLTSQWMNTYPSTYVSGDIQIQSEQSNEIASALSTMSSLQDNDLIYVQNHVENMKQFEKDQGAIRIFIYGFHFTIMLIAVFVLFNLLSQYMAQIKRELSLLNIIGMSKKNIQIQFIQRAIIFTTISIFLFISIDCMITYLIQSLTTLSFDILLLMKYTIGYCMVLLFFMVILTLLILRKTTKTQHNG